jgi:ADP-heptose:LPS heptosyltransferase
VSDVLIAPFSNSDIRDWPLQRFTELVGLLLPRLPETMAIRIIGAPGQKLRANEVVRPYPAERVFNDCGRRPWGEVLVQLKAAACVIGNNSGIGHLGGRLGAPTVCVFGGSHPRHEWRPLGANVILVSRVIGCSPCQLDHTSGSPYRKACLREIEAQTVADAAMTIMARIPRPSIARDGAVAPGRLEARSA